MTDAKHAAKIIDVMREAKARHGQGRQGDRAYLAEMLARDDLPAFVRAQMQNALNRHQQRETIERATKPKDSTA